MNTMHMSVVSNVIIFNHISSNFCLNPPQMIWEGAKIIFILCQNGL